MVTISEYRKMLKDYTSTDEQIKKRLEYIESLCRNVIRQELQNYENKTTQSSNTGTPEL